MPSSFSSSHPPSIHHHPSHLPDQTDQRITSATTKMHAPIGGLRHFFQMRASPPQVVTTTLMSESSPRPPVLHQHLLNLTLHVVSRLGIGRCSTSFLERIAVQDPRRVAAQSGEPHAQPRVATQPPTLDPLPEPSAEVTVKLMWCFPGLLHDSPL